MADPCSQESILASLLAMDVSPDLAMLVSQSCTDLEGAVAMLALLQEEDSEDSEPEQPSSPTHNSSSPSHTDTACATASDKNSDALATLLRDCLLAADGDSGPSTVAQTRRDRQEEAKVVVVVRADLNMGRGKIASQVAHACLSASRGCPPPLRRDWESHGEPIVVVQCRGPKALMEIFMHAHEKGLAAHPIFDAGRTQVRDGEMTCLALGPAPRSQVDEVSGKLKLL